MILIIVLLFVLFNQVRNGHTVNPSQDSHVVVSDGSKHLVWKMTALSLQGGELK